ncbi:MAG: YkgJ family cysteine cluster protein [Promethearchaeota archaeon]
MDNKKKKSKKEKQNKRDKEKEKGERKKKGDIIHNKKEPSNTLKLKKYSPIPADRFKLILQIDAMIKHHEKNVNLKINLPKNIYFKCNQCGNCCKNAKYRIAVNISDMANWIMNKKKIYLRALDYFENHPRQVFYLIIKEEFQKYMIKNHGKGVYERFLKINPSLKSIRPQDLKDCVFYNSIDNSCSIYQNRPLYCVMYPEFLLYELNYKSLYSEAFKQVARMKLKDKDFKAFLENDPNFEIRCPKEVLAENSNNLKKLKLQKNINRLKKMIIADLFSGSLYFKNRKDIFEEIFKSLFGKR